jgi:hypothetical protein
VIQLDALEINLFLRSLHPTVTVSVTKRVTRNNHQTMPKRMNTTRMAKLFSRRKTSTTPLLYHMTQKLTKTKSSKLTGSRWKKLLRKATQSLSLSTLAWTHTVDTSRSASSDSNVICSINFASKQSKFRRDRSLLRLLKARTKKSFGKSTGATSSSASKTA